MNSRLVAVRLLQEVLVRGKSLTEVMSDDQLKDGEEASFIRMLVFGVIRWHERLRFWLNSLLEHPLRAKDRDVEILLLAGLFQLAYSTRPAHACVNETVAVARLLNKAWASGLVNGVLRRFARQADSLRRQADLRPESRYSLPSWLAARLQKDHGAAFDAIAGALCLQAPMTLRVNLRKQSRADFLLAMDEAGIGAEAHPELDTAVTLTRPCDVHEIPGFPAGSCSVQDAAAQWCTHWLDLAPGQRLLDACAAPGGKTAACLEAEPGLGKVIAVDIDGDRQARTIDTLARLGLSADTHIADAQQATGWWDGEPFDRILVDAPCSATGVIRRHPDIKILRRDSDIAALHKVQTGLLESLWELLAVDGLLLYATCSLLSSENEAVIGSFLNRHGDAEDVELPPIQGSEARRHGLLLLPQEGGHDGFYYALLRKKSMESSV